MSNVYDADPVTIFAVLLPTVLLLDAGLVGESRGFVSYGIVAAVLIGWFVREVFVFAVLLGILHHFSKDRSKKGFCCTDQHFLTPYGVVSWREHA